MVHNTIGFARETNSSFIPWSRDAFFKGQQPKNGQKSAIGLIAKIDQHKILFPLTLNLIGFVSKFFSPMTSWSRDQYVSAKNVHGNFQIWTCSRTLSKNKIQDQAKCQMARTYTLPIKMTKACSGCSKIIKWIMNIKQRVFLFLLTIDFLNMLTDLAFLIPTLSLFHTFMLYIRKKCFLKDFVLFGTGLV